MMIRLSFARFMIVPSVGWPHGIGRADWVGFGSSETTDVTRNVPWTMQPGRELPPAGSRFT